MYHVLEYGFSDYDFVSKYHRVWWEGYAGEIHALVGIFGTWCWLS